MKIIDLLKMSLGNLWRRKLRTILTLMGVVIGTASIIIMVSLGVGMKNSINESLKDLGSLNIITVTKAYNFDKVNDTKKKDAVLNDEAIEKISKIKGVTVVSPVKSMSVMLRHGKYYAYATINAVKKDLLAAQKIKLASGELFDENTKFSFLFGGQMAYEFQNPRASGPYGDFYFPTYDESGKPMERPKPKVDVMNDTILLNPDTRYGRPEVDQKDKLTIPRPTKIKVSGVVAEGNWQFDYNIFTSLETYDKIAKDYEKWQKKIQQQNGNQGQGSPGTIDINSRNGKSSKKKEEYNQVQVFVQEVDDIERVIAAIRELGFNTNSMLELAKQVGGFADVAQMVLGGIGGVSLIVAAIGISNTMVMSIYERTKEIGVMKVIGASLNDIQGMFLTEAALIGLIGGIVGLLFSTSVSLLLNFLTKNIDIFGAGMAGGEAPPLSIIPFWLYALGMIFTTLVGLISGYLPARRAMKLSVLKALRNE